MFPRRHGREEQHGRDMFEDGTPGLPAGGALEILGRDDRQRRAGHDRDVHQRPGRQRGHPCFE
eukprot:12088897-Alexandrium_andersonii.AAC.1